MKCGKAQQIIEWAAASIIANPEKIIMVASSDSEQGKVIMAHIADYLELHHAEATKNWRTSPWRIRTNEGGHIELFASRRDRVVRGYRVDEFLATDTCEHSVVETGRWTEATNGRKADPHG